MGRLKVSRAEYAGACYGVQRALDLTLETANADKTVCTLGPLIHNPQVVSDLAARGIRVADTVEDCTEQAWSSVRMGSFPKCSTRLLPAETRSSMLPVLT